jgi:hypothetical protein
MHDSASTICFAEGQLLRNERTLGNEFPQSACGCLSPVDSGSRLQGFNAKAQIIPGFLRFAGGAWKVRCADFRYAP